MNSWTIRTKLTLWYTSIFGGTLVLFGLLTYLAFSYANNERIDVGLKEEADGIAHYDQMNENSFRKYVERISNERDEEWASGKYVAILNHAGNLQFRSGNLKDEPLSLNSHQITEILSGKTYFKTVRIANGRLLRIITVPRQDTRELIQIGIVVNKDTTLNIFLFVLSALGFLAIIGSWFGGRFMAKKALKPISRMIKELQEIEPEHLRKRLSLHPAKDEINELSGVINEMLSRLENAFNQIRQFTADASHELRTPIAIMKAGIEVSLSKERAIHGYQQVLANTMEDLGRLSKIVENLFILAKADAGQYALHKERISLRPVIMDIAEQLKLIAEPKNIFVSTEKMDNAFVEGDELLIRMMLLNLIDNAVKYTQPKGAIQLSLCKDNGWVKITIQDTGIGISQEDSVSIFDRFYRANKARTADHTGGGLGLNICQWVVKSHYGTITVESKLHEGSVFTVALPTC